MTRRFFVSLLAAMPETFSAIPGEKYYFVCRFKNPQSDIGSVLDFAKQNDCDILDIGGVCFFQRHDANARPLAEFEAYLIKGFSSQSDAEKFSAQIDQHLNCTVAA